jgi:hypothetical protein
MYEEGQELLVFGTEGKRKIHVCDLEIPLVDDTSVTEIVNDKCLRKLLLNSDVAEEAQGWSLEYAERQNLAFPLGFNTNKIAPISLADLDKEAEFSNFAYQHGSSGTLPPVTAGCVRWMMNPKQNYVWALRRNMTHKAETIPAVPVSCGGWRFETVYGERLYFGFYVLRFNKKRVVIQFKTQHLIPNPAFGIEIPHTVGFTQELAIKKHISKADSKILYSGIAMGAYQVCPKTGRLRQRTVLTLKKKV